MSTSSAKGLYMDVVQDVIDKVKDSFLDESVDENVLQELKSIWEKKLTGSKALQENVPDQVQANTIQQQSSSSSQVIRGQTSNQPRAVHPQVSGAHSSGHQTSIQSYNQQPKMMSARNPIHPGYPRQILPHFNGHIPLPMAPAFPFGPGLFSTQRMGVPSIARQGFKFFNLPIQTSHSGQKMITLRVPDTAFVQGTPDYTQLQRILSVANSTTFQSEIQATQFLQGQLNSIFQMN